MASSRANTPHPVMCLKEFIREAPDLRQAYLSFSAAGGAIQLRTMARVRRGISLLQI